MEQRDWPFLAHSANERGETELLRDHLVRVRDRAADFAAAFAAQDEAALAGVLHDLGKYSEAFQRRLQGLERGVDHWSAGAWAALQRGAIAAALAAQGHHIGLRRATRDSLLATEPDKSGPNGRPGSAERSTTFNELVERATADGLDVLGSAVSDPLFGPSLRSRPDAVAAMLDVRMLFSALVDADYLETERHFSVDRVRPAGLTLEPERALRALREHVRTLRFGSTASAEVAAMRDDLMTACLTAAGGPTGCFTLTAPTGTGKTLAMLAFALEHARRHQLRRIVVVIPYLSIIEQTVEAFRRVFCSLHLGENLDRYVLEHHSLAGTRGAGDPADGTREADDQAPERGAARLLAENWDAPIVVTTSVQMLESLFSNRPAACRKLHRLASSVVLFDEVQTMPRSLAIPTLAALSRLSARFRASVVFATATQPAFAKLDGLVRQFADEGWNPKEIVPESIGLSQRARRVRVSWPRSTEDTTEWADVADRIASESQVLCVVNLKRHASRLCDGLRRRGVDGLFHLSTSLCPTHRRQVLTDVRGRLAAGRPCRLISTQCIEAGVDVDFPIAMRAFGPLDAIVQAAGRCNRGGRLESGEVRVFVPEPDGMAYPDGAYRQAADVLSVLLRQRGALDLDDPAVVREYYEALFAVADLDAEGDELLGAIRELDFERVAARYRLIREGAINVVVPYELDVWKALRDEAEQLGLSRSWIGRARSQAVNLFRPRGDKPVWSHLLPVIPTSRRRGAGRDDVTEWFVYLEESHYDPLLGLTPPESSECLIG